MWSKTLANRDSLRELPPTELSELPLYAAVFFFRNMGSFRPIFWALTCCSVLSAGLGFYSVYLLGDIISNVKSCTSRDLLYYYLPLYAGSVLCRESLDYYLRRYAEAFPTVYSDHVSLRFFKSFLGMRHAALLNISKERLSALVGRYTGALGIFLADWFWGTSRKVTWLIITLIILYRQSPVILLLNLAYMICFLLLAFRLSAKFGRLTREFALQNLETSTVVGSFMLHLNTATRLGVRDFFEQQYTTLIENNWLRLEEIRAFHAFRWLLQLNIFNVLYVGTLFYGMKQVIEGSLPLGYLVLIKYAFDRLWETLVYLIEYFVSLIEQRENARIIRAEFAALLETAVVPLTTIPPTPPILNWSQIQLKEIQIQFVNDKGNAPIAIALPELTIGRRSKIGIVGPSGAGKTTILNVLLGLVPFSGELLIDGVPAQPQSLPPSEIALITNYDPLFNLTIRSNILLGREISPERLEQILTGTRVSEFLRDLDQRVGTPRFNLSTGQEQRIRLARGLLQDAGLFLLDEPFNGLDAGNRADIMNFVASYLQNKALILVTHDRDELSLVDTIYELSAGTLTRAQ